MKQLISLSLKYIRRQKLRTWLTFLCVTLAVFIFNLLAGAADIVRNAMIRNVIDRSGEWEMCADPIIETHCKNEMDRREQELLSDGNHPDGLTDEDRDRLQKELNELQEKMCTQVHGHIAVDKSFSFKSGDLFWNGNGSPSDGRYHYFEVTAGGKTAQQQNFRTVQGWGDSSLLPQYVGTYRIPDELCTGEENLIFLPKSMEAEGWKKGDAYEITITPASGTIPDDSEQVEAIRKQHEQEISEHPGALLFREIKPVRYGEDGERIRDSEEQEYILQKSKLNAMKQEYGFANIQFSDVERYASGTLKLTVGGFVPDGFRGIYGFGDDELYLSFGTDLSVLEGITKINSDLVRWETDTDDDGNLAGTMPVTLAAGMNASTYLTFRPDLNFDDAALQLYRDLGLNPNESDAVLHPILGKERLYNTELLSLELRNTDSIADWLTDAEFKFPLLLAVVIVTFLLWLLMRMVIDNAFEISVQERRAQFATLRIMGASRRQVAVLVCLEALFYCIAAIPLGMLAAYLCAKLAAHTLNGLGLGTVYHASPLLLLIFTVIAVSAVFFSAYGSSMWAARAYAPLEASKRPTLKGNRKKNIFTRDLFGDPEERARKRAEKRARKEKGLPQAPKKAKLRRTSSGFLRHYTVRNIRRTRRRFIVSVVTMTVGVILFFFGSMIGLFLSGVYAKAKDDIKTADFRLDFLTFEGKTVEEAEKRFSDDPLFADVHADFIFTMRLKENEGKAEFEQADSGAAKHLYSWRMKDSASMQDTDEFFNYCTAVLVTPKEYAEIFEPVTGVSYAEWSESLTAYFVLADKNAQGDSALNTFREPAVLQTAGDGGFRLPLTGTLRLSQADTERFGAHHESFSWAFGKGDTYYRLIMPASALDKSDYGGDGMTNIDFTVRGTDDYKAAKEELLAFCQEHAGEVELHDEYYSGTGFRTLVAAIITIAAIVLVSIWLTGILTMVNTVNTGVLNRADELMMLRTVGMSKKAVRRTVRLESMIFSGTATLIGCIIGLAGAFFLFTKMNLGSEDLWVLPLIFAAIGVALLLTVLLNLLVASVAAKPALRTLNARMEEGGIMQ